MSKDPHGISEGDFVQIKEYSELEETYGPDLSYVNSYDVNFIRVHAGKKLEVIKVLHDRVYINNLSGKCEFWCYFLIGEISKVFKKRIKIDDNLFKMD